MYTAKNNNLSEGLKHVVLTLIMYLPYITNIIRYSYLTNVPIERINNKIKLVTQGSYGIEISRIFISKNKMY